MSSDSGDILASLKGYNSGTRSLVHNSQLENQWSLVCKRWNYFVSEKNHGQLQYTWFSTK